MIPDDELRTLFKAESGEHLGSLESCLLRIEQGRADEQTLNQIFRDAHSLKGAARMLELTDIELLMHAMEELLRLCRDQKQPPTPAALDALLSSLDAAKALVGEAVLGESAPIDLRVVVDALHHAVAAAEKPAQPSPAAPSTDTPPPAPSQPSAERPAQAERPAAPPTDDRTSLPDPVVHERRTRPDDSDRRGDASAYRIDTVRVPTARLDGLMRQCGELIVTQQRMMELESGLSRLISELEQTAYAAARGDRNPQRSHQGRARESELAQQALALRERLRSDNRELGTLARSLAENVRNARMLPLSTLFNLFPRMVRDIAHQEGKDVELVFDGGDTTADKNVVEQLKDPLMHILRNAVHHGIESPAERVRVGKSERGRIRLSAVRKGASIQIRIHDDGRGVDLERAAAAVASSESQGEATSVSSSDLERDGDDKSRAAILNALFRPGVTTETMITDISGRGVGLDAARRAVEDLKGSVEIGSEAGQFFQIQLELPITLATTRVLLVCSGELNAALPLDSVQRLFRLSPDQVYQREGMAALDHHGQALSVLDLGETFGQSTLPVARRRSDVEHCVIIRKREQQIALLVDSISGVQDVLMHPTGGILRRVVGVAGTAILSSGEVCAVLNPADLLEMPWRASGLAPVAHAAEAHERIQDAERTLLLVEDSMLTRLQEKRLLEAAGYRVITAADGAAAWEMLNPTRDRGERVFGRSSVPNAVVADINMPRLDGLQLTERLRADPRLRKLPIVLVTSLASADDQRRGLEAGADAYITKGSFNNQLLLSTLERLI